MMPFAVALALLGAWIANPLPVVPYRGHWHDNVPGSGQPGDIVIDSDQVQIGTSRRYRLVDAHAYGPGWLLDLAMQGRRTGQPGCGSHQALSHLMIVPVPKLLATDPEAALFYFHAGVIPPPFATLKRDRFMCLVEPYRRLGRY